MKHLKRKNENLSISSRPQLIKYCEWKDCNNKGKYKAPKSIRCGVCAIDLKFTKRWLPLNL